MKDNLTPEQREKRFNALAVVIGFFLGIICISIFSGGAICPECRTVRWLYGLNSMFNALQAWSIIILLALIYYTFRWFESVWAINKVKPLLLTIGIGMLTCGFFGFVSSESFIDWIK